MPDWPDPKPLGDGAGSIVVRREAGRPQTATNASRAEPALDCALAFGAVVANAMLYPRVVLATAILNPALVAALVRYVAAPALLAAIATAAVRATQNRWRGQRSRRAIRCN